jgi:serine/threonine-protein kinase
VVEAKESAHFPDDAINTLAILPLVNGSTDPDTEYLSDGITESLINTLSQLTHLRVMARSTVFRYKGQEVDAQRVGGELDVRMALAGKVLKLGERLVISAELVRTSDGSQFWGEQYNRQNSDVFAIQEEIAGEITTKLRLKLSSEEKKRLIKRNTGNVEAYHLYLKGCYFWNKYTEEGLRKAVEYFRRAIEAEPGYALAHTGLADSYLRLSNAYMPPREAMPKAKTAAQDAVEIDDSLAEAHSSLGVIKMVYDHDWTNGGREFERAIELNPGASLAHQRYGSYLMYMGRFDEALAEFRSALDIDPLSLQANVGIGAVLYLMCRYERAAHQIRKALELDQNYPPARMVLGRIYMQTENFPEAIAEFERVEQLDGEFHISLGCLAYAYAVWGKADEAKSVIAELKAIAKRRYVSPYSIAIIYAGLGARARALEWLERTYEDRSDWLVWLRVGPELDSLRTHPRFVDLLRRVGLPN